ncbi:MAG: Methionyl-tRNA formyltransferase [Parcubacteria group bacterium GW2011_GWA2_46_39]|nr:MAG: Methionyl-tRNA formyltransferase [Parcubacteria group bacterium GW2011_GWA2_46_39]
MNFSLNTKAPKFVFFGGADFSTEVLQYLLEAGWIPSLVITNKPQPVGRRQILTPSPVFDLAKQRQLPILEVAGLKGGKWRGPSPIQYSLLNGDDETGVSLMLLDAEIDHGPVVAQEKVLIEPDETYLELAKRLGEMGAKLLVDKVPDYLSGVIKPQTQDHSQATFCKIIKREDGKIDWSRPAREIYNQWRAFTPWPGIYTVWNNKRLKLLEVAPAEIKSSKPRLVTIDGKRLVIGCGQGCIEVNILQLEGAKPLSAADFVKGHRDLNNARLLV